MKGDFSVEVNEISAGETPGILIKTQGYMLGEKVTVVFEGKSTNDDGGSFTIDRRVSGVVDKRGEARVLIKTLKNSGNAESDDLHGKLYE